MAELNERHLGFTLIECVIATAVFALAVATLGATLSLAASRQSRATRQGQALELALEILEEAEASLALGESPSLRGTRGGHSWTVLLSDLDAVLKRATVSVEWPEGQAPHSMALSRILLPAGPR